MFKRRRQHWLNSFYLFVLIVCPGLYVLAQDDPFGIKDDAPKAPAPATGKPATAKPSGLAIDDGEQDPLVLSLRESEPTTAAELLRAVKLMVDIDRLDEAQRYLGELQVVPVSDEEAFGLLRQYGSAFLIELRSKETLQPGAGEWALGMSQAAARYARSPEHLSGLLAQLQAPTAKERTLALRELQAVGGPALSYLIQQLADADETTQATIHDTLIAWPAGSDDAMRAGLQADRAVVRAAAADVLAVRGELPAVVDLIPVALAEADEVDTHAARRALTRITGAVPNRNEATAWLYRTWQARNKAIVSGSLVGEDARRIWSWDPVERTVIESEVTAVDAARHDRAKLAEALLELQSDSPEFLRMAWTSRLELAKLQLGREHRLVSGDLPGGDSPGLEVLLQILERGLSEADPVAAIGAIELLGSVGDESLLQSQGGEVSLLVQAMRHSHRRLRLAAVETTLGWNPTKPFPGGNRVAEVLAYLVQGAGQPRILIGHTNAQKTQNLVGLFDELGYEAHSELTGRRLFFQAVADPDYVAILISDTLDRPEALELVQQLRKDPRTSRIPVGLVSRLETMERARRIARDIDQVIAFPWPHSAESAALALRELEALDPEGWPEIQERRRQAIRAFELLGQVARSSKVFGFDDLFALQPQIIKAIYDPSLTESALGVAAEIATPQIQTAVVDFASLDTLPVEQRRAAVDAFAQAVKKRGLLLTTRQIQTQYDRYNGSEFAGAETQEVLGQVLDVIEGQSGLSSRAGG